MEWESSGRNFKFIFKKHGFIIVLSFVLLIVAMFFRESLYGIFGEQNYVTVHFVMEILIITTALTIAIQSWTVFPHNFSNYRLWIGAVFFSVVILEIAHTITFKGMPYFFGESSPYRATWFFIVGRLTEVLGLLAIIAFKNRMVAPQKRIVAYSIAFIYSIFWIVIIFNPEHLLPELVIEGVGTTAIKNNLQYMGIAAEVFLIILLAFRNRTMEMFNVMLIVASLYMMTADYIFTTYKSVFDINNFIGHWFQLAGFYFLQRAIYVAAVEEPLQKLDKARKHLKQSEKFLQTITSNMGEGLIVMDVSGNVTYLNIEAARLIQWTSEEILGKNFHDLVHKDFECSNYLFCKYPKNQASLSGEPFRLDKTIFSRKNGTMFPASCVVTPFYENESLTGSILAFRDITQQIKDQELIQYMAFYDELTKLPNTRYLKERWSEILQYNPNQKIVILILDIDRFKIINEALGHSFGDLILKATAARLKKLLSASKIARLTGDEFAIILPYNELELDVKAIVEKIEEIMREPIQAQSQPINITMTIGVAVYPDHGNTIEELLQHANMALVEALAQNKSYQFYDPSMDGKALDHLVLQNDLYHALEMNELHLVYQPQINLETGKITGVEALLRWHHSKFGVISPYKFIPIAEETGLILPIGEWVIRTACRQVREWLDQGLPEMVVGVNLSIRQFYQQNLAEKIKQILIETNLPAQYLELEITESMMMNMDHTKKMLESLKAIGVHIAIDDFGTGYSSLSYIKHLNVDRLKIDKSFIRDLITNENDTTIVSMIISVAHHLHFNVIAEGVETPKQKEILQKLNCLFVQGYLYSPPLPPEELIRQLEPIQKKAAEA